MKRLLIGFIFCNVVAEPTRETTSLLAYLTSQPKAVQKIALAYGATPVVVEVSLMTLWGQQGVQLLSLGVRRHVPKMH